MLPDGDLIPWYTTHEHKCLVEELACVLILHSDLVEVCDSVRVANLSLQQAF
jgi:hypothetical protein